MSGSTVIIINESRVASLPDAEKQRVDDMVDELKSLTGCAVCSTEDDVSDDD